jgi:hypothetical protein
MIFVHGLGWFVQAHIINFRQNATWVVSTGGTGGGATLSVNASVEVLNGAPWGMKGSLESIMVSQCKQVCGPRPHRHTRALALVTAHTLTEGHRAVICAWGAPFTCRLPLTYSYVKTYAIALNTSRTPEAGAHSPELAKRACYHHLMFGA